MIATVIAAVLSNWFLVLFVIALCTTFAKMRRHGAAGSDLAGVAWRELVFYMVGIGYAYAGIFHAYFQSIVAPSIGWQPSPFEYELGWMEIGLGIVAMLSMWRGREFRLAATIGLAVFSLAAAAQHIAQIACCHNDAPGNAGLVVWFADILLPLLLVAVAAVAYRSPETV